MVKMKMLFLYMSLACLINAAPGDPIEACTQLTSCSCQTSKGIIDLSPLALSSGEPRFKDQQDASGSYYFSWNPCNPFTEDLTNCNGVAGCQTDMENYYSLGTPDSAEFIVDSTKGLILSYSATIDVKRSLDVILICDESEDAKLDVAGENPPGSAIYEMTLTSKYCCPMELHTTTSTTEMTTTTQKPTPKPCHHTYNEQIITMILIAILVAFLLLLMMCFVIITLLVCYHTKQSPANNKKSYDRLN